MSLGLVLQALAGGAATGAAYGLVGLGFALIYRVNGVLNFAHGDLVTTGIFTFLLVLGGAGGAALAGVAPPVVALAVVGAVVVAGLMGLLIQRAAVAPFVRRGSTAGWIAATVAAGLFLRALIGVGFQGESYAVPDILVHPLGAGGVVALPGGGVVQVRSIILFVIAVALAVAFDRWTSLSRTGRAMRAVALDERAAELCGISPGRARAVAWMTAGVLAAVAGLLVAPARPVSIDFGVLLGLKGTAAAVLGRLGSARGTIVAGIAIGVGESIVTSLSIPALSLGTLQLPGLGPFPGLQDVGALSVLVAAIALLPRLVGDTPIERD
ncbi:MAG: branched-chain amino acid transport system permease protein [Chloroflexota bacterium]|jgi:branched-subunit amino acid ABC-type transport system permease component|nr:branched-chain amino acid transport system permease protein [Chloroflexota bacterium]